MSLSDRIKSIFDVHSRRHLGEKDEYVVPQQLRNRILILYRDVAGSQSTGYGGNHFWQEMHSSMEYLHGRSNLSNTQTAKSEDDVWTFLHRCSTNDLLDFIELSFKLEVSREVVSNDIVDTINEFLRLEDAPYQLTRIVEVEEEIPGESQFGNSGYTRLHTIHPRVIRVDEEVTHREAIAPSLEMLAAPYFKTAHLELLGAMEDYRKSDYSDCLTKCCSAFESVLKVICERKKWQFSHNDTAGPLLATVIGNSDLEGFFEQPLMLIATIRNRLSSSHGAGSRNRTVERHVAQYAVTSTAAAIVLLIQETGL